MNTQTFQKFGGAPTLSFVTDHLMIAWWNAMNLLLLPLKQSFSFS